MENCDQDVANKKKMPKSGNFGPLEPSKFEEIIQKFDAV